MGDRKRRAEPEKRDIPLTWKDCLKDYGIGTVETNCGILLVGGKVDATDIAECEDYRKKGYCPRGFA